MTEDWESHHSKSLHTKEDGKLRMSDNNGVIDNDNSDLDAVIEEIKKEFKMMLGKRKDLIIKLGEALERKGLLESICEEIKNALREEIAEGLVSSRIIELHCPDKWKKKTKPKKAEKNENISFSGQEQKAIPQLLVDTHGNTVVEPASDPDNNDAVNNEGSANEQAKNTGEFHAGNESEDAIGKSANADQQQLLLSEQDREKELEPRTGGIKSDLQSKSETHILNNQEDKLLDLRFEVPFEHLRKHMELSLRKHIESIWFFVKVDLVTKNVSDVQLD